MKDKKEKVNKGLSDAELVNKYGNGKVNLSRLLKPMLQTVSNFAVLKKAKRIS